MTTKVRRADRARRPFWLHQAADYLLGIVLVMQGLQMPEPLVPAVAGVVVMLNAATAKGPLGAFWLAGRRAHRIADLVVLAFLVIAGVLAMVWYYTDFAERPERSARRDAQAGPRSEEIGRSAGRVAGNLVKDWCRRDP